MTNTAKTYKLTVNKTLKGLGELPDGFKVTVSYQGTDGKSVEHVLTKTALSERDRNVYREYALEGRDIGEVAAKYKISRNYVSQIKIRIDKRIVAVGQSLVAGDGESS